MNATQLRPLGIGEILDVAMKIVWRNAGTLVRAVVVVVLPIQVLSTVILLSALPDDVNATPGFFNTVTPESDTVLSGSDFAALAAGFGTTAVLGFLGGLLAAGACYRAIASAYLGDATGWRDSLRYAA